MERRRVERRGAACCISSDRTIGTCSCGWNCCCCCCCCWGGLFLFPGPVLEGSAGRTAPEERRENVQVLVLAVLMVVVLLVEGHTTIPATELLTLTWVSIAFMALAALALLLLLLLLLLPTGTKPKTRGGSNSRAGGGGWEACPWGKTTSATKVLIRLQGER